MDAQYQKSPIRPLMIGLTLVGATASLHNPFAVTGLAYAKGTEGADARFDQLDINQDGWLSGMELQGGRWLKYDQNGDKEVTKQEFAVGQAKEKGQALTTQPKGSPVSRKNYGKAQPLTQADVLYYVRSLGYDVVVKNIEERGVNFKLTDEVEGQIKKFAMPDTVVPITTAIRQNYRVSGNTLAQQKALASRIKPGRYAGGIIADAGPGPAGHYEARPDITIIDAKKYKMGSATGTYSYTPSGRIIRWVSGPLAGHKWSGEYLPNGYENGPQDDRHIMDGDTITLYNEKHQILYSAKRADK